MNSESRFDARENLDNYVKNLDNYVNALVDTKRNPALIFKMSSRPMSALEVQLLDYKLKFSRAVTPVSALLRTVCNFFYISRTFLDLILFVDEWYRHNSPTVSPVQH